MTTTEYACIVCLETKNQVYYHKNDKGMTNCQGYVCHECMYDNESLRMNNCPYCRETYKDGYVYVINVEKNFHTNIDENWYIRLANGLYIIGHVYMYIIIILNIVVFILGCINNKKYNNNDDYVGWAYFLSFFILLLTSYVIIASGANCFHHIALWMIKINYVNNGIKWYIITLLPLTYILVMLILAILDYAQVIVGVQFFIGSYGWWFYMMWIGIIFGIPAVIIVGISLIILVIWLIYIIIKIVYIIGQWCLSTICICRYNSIANEHIVKITPVILENTVVIK